MYSTHSKLQVAMLTCSSAIQAPWRSRSITNWCSVLTKWLSWWASTSPCSNGRPASPRPAFTRTLSRLHFAHRTWTGRGRVKGSKSWYIGHSWYSICVGSWFELTTAAETMTVKWYVCCCCTASEAVTEIEMQFCQ